MRVDQRRVGLPRQPAAMSPADSTGPPGPQQRSTDRRAGVGAASEILLAALLTAAALAAIAPGLVMRGEGLAGGDLERFHRPVKHMLIRLHDAQGGIPWWTPDLAQGQPFAANPNFGVLHPTAALFLVLPFELAFSLWVLLPLGIGAASMVWLLGVIGRSRRSALVLGPCWALGGPGLSMIAMPPVAWTLALAPATLGCAVRWWVSGRRGWLAGLAVCFALQCSGGSPVGLALTLLLLPAVMVDASEGWDPRPAGPRGPVRAVGLVVGLGLGLALAAPAVLPQAALAGRSVRAAGEVGLELGSWSLPIERLVEPWLPRVAQPIPGRVWTRDRYDPPEDRPLVASLFPGALVAALMLAELLRRSRASLAWALTLGVCVVLASGANSPVWKLIEPVMEALLPIRFPEKWALGFGLAAAVLASRALDRLQAGRRGSATAVLGLLGAGAAGAVAAGVWALAQTPASLGPGLAPQTVAGAAVATAVGAVLGAGAVLLIAVRPSRLAWAMVLAAAMADLALAGRPLLPSRPLAELERVPEVLRPVLPPPRTTLFHLAAWQPECRVRAPALPPRPVQWDIPLALDPDYDLTRLAWSDRAFRALASLGSRRPDLLPAALARRSIGAVLACAPGRREDATLRRVDRPRAAVACASAVESLPSLDRWGEVLSRIPPDQVRTTALVGPEAGWTPGREPGPCRVGGLEERPDSISMQVEALGPGPSLLTVNRTWDDRWRARIDGRRAPLLRCDGDLSALIIAPGTRLVVLEYHEPMLARGVATAALAAAALLVWCGLGRRRGAGSKPSDRSAGRNAPAGAPR